MAGFPLHFLTIAALSGAGEGEEEEEGEMRGVAWRVASHSHASTSPVGRSGGVFNLALAGVVFFSETNEYQWILNVDHAFVEFQILSTLCCPPVSK